MGQGWVGGGDAGSRPLSKCHTETQQLKQAEPAWSAESQQSPAVPAAVKTHMGVGSVWERRGLEGEQHVGLFGMSMIPELSDSRNATP